MLTRSLLLTAPERLEWTTSELPLEGQFYHLPKVAFDPLPIQPGAPTVWVGGSSQDARRRAGPVGAAWHSVDVTVDEFTDQSKIVLEMARQDKRSAPSLAPHLPIRFR